MAYVDRFGLLRSLRLLLPASLTFALSAVALNACANGDNEARDDFGLDPNLPGLDAAADPGKARMPDRDGAASNAETGSPADATSSDASPSDSGVKTFVDASPVDAGPTYPKPGPHEVVISEIMYNTFGPEPESEWFELHSLAPAPRSLSGLTLKDSGGRIHVIGAGIVIGAGQYLVFARNRAGALTAKVPAAAIAYDYGLGLPDNAGILLANSAVAALSLLNGPVVIAHAPYGAWFSQSGGSSVQLYVFDPSLVEAKESWCLSTAAWTSGSEKGTPGAAEDCP